MATGAADYMGYFLWKRLFMGAGVVLPLFWITPNPPHSTWDDFYSFSGLTLFLFLHRSSHRLCVVLLNHPLLDLFFLNTR